MPPATMAEAVKHITDVGYKEGEDAYRDACEFLVDHRGELTQQVYIDLPGGLSGNTDPAWTKVKDESEARCGCGNERVILPENPRIKFEPSPNGPQVMNAEKPVVYLKPKGGTKASTYCTLTFHPDERCLEYMMEPFAPLVFTPDIFSRPGWKLDDLVEPVSRHRDDNPLVIKHSKYKMPICALNAVDNGSTPSVTITPDKDVELLTEKEPDSDHACSGE